MTAFVVGLLGGCLSWLLVFAAVRITRALDHPRVPKPVLGDEAFIALRRFMKRIDGLGDQATAIREVLKTHRFSEEQLAASSMRYSDFDGRFDDHYTWALRQNGVLIAATLQERTRAVLTEAEEKTIERLLAESDKP